MRRRLLIVSPHFPPVNAPDHQRVRMALPYLRENGWEATVLAVSPEHVEGAVYEPQLMETVPGDVEVVRTAALPIGLTRKLGFGSLALRAYAYLRGAGDRLLSSGRFQAVFFSTTQFPMMALGRRWRKRFGVPYVLDFQDPWRSDYYDTRKAERPPGGWFKYGFSQLQARLLESKAVKGAAHMVSVSRAYETSLRGRYPWLREGSFTILPFGAPEADFQQCAAQKDKRTIFDSGDGKRHWVYVGRAGADMGLALRALFGAVAQACQANPLLRERLHLHFLGTSYAPADRREKSVEPLAAEYGLSGMVSERAARLPYFEALHCLLGADALIVPGSDDPGYTASKIYPYILANKPLLAIFHEESSVVEVLTKTRAGIVVTFRTGERVGALAGRITEAWFERMPPTSPQTDWVAFAPYTAREMTRKLCAMFDRVVNGRGSHQ